MRRTASWLLLLALLPMPVLADAPPEETAAAEQEVQVEEEDERTKHPIPFYLPNRIFDLLDLVRARVRVGPGVAGSLRATRPASLTAGFYASLFAGLPGPRGRVKIPWPAGLESSRGPT